MHPLTETPLALDKDGYQRATQSELLRSAANGEVPDETRGKWLANDRLYIHNYIRGIGRLNDFLNFPDTATELSEEPVTSKFFTWFVGALSNIKREEKLFINKAAAYGIEVNLKTNEDGHVPDSTKLKACAASRISSAQSLQAPRITFRGRTTRYVLGHGKVLP